nr:MAG TPA: hypothetical protein [Caudoviricetes sp.]
MDPIFIGHGYLSWFLTHLLLLPYMFKINRITKNVPEY